MKISTSPAYFEALLNEPRMFAAVSNFGLEKFDLAEAWPVCIGMEFPGGGFLVKKLEDGHVDAHAVFPKGGAQARRAAAEALQYLFTETDTTLLTTTVPDSTPWARAFVEEIGMRRLLVVEGGHHHHAGHRENLSLMAMGVDDWVPHSHKMGEVGRGFLEHKGVQLHFGGSALRCHVGFLLNCLKNGLPWKGIDTFNRFALSVNLAPCRMEFDRVDIPAVSASAYFSEV